MDDRARFWLKQNQAMQTARGLKGTMEISQPEFNDREDPARLNRIYKAIQRFNRNTTWVATGLLGSVVFAALMIALQDLQSKSEDLASQSSVDLSPGPSGVATTEATPIAISNAEIVSEQPAKLGPGSTPVINQPAVKPDLTSQSQVSGASAVSINEKNQKGRLRSSAHSRYVGAKARLIALWHQHLRHQKSLGWTLSNDWRKKKISYTTATNH